MTILDKQRYAHIEPSPYWSDYYNYDCNHYMEVDLGRPNLVICYGDSWTWGDSIGQARAKDRIEDTEFRSRNVYGYHVAEALDADFVNSAVPGIFNYWVHDRLTILCNHDIEKLQNRYDKIYIIVTLTELGREFTFNYYVPDFQKHYDWTVESDCSAERLLCESENFDFVKLKQIQNRLPANCELIVGRNFTNTFDQNKSILDNLLPDTWTDLLLEKQYIVPLLDVRVVSYGLQNFAQFMRSQQLETPEYIDWFLNHASILAHKQLDLLGKSIYNYNKATKHPTPEGHKLWADYIVNYIKTL